MIYLDYSATTPVDPQVAAAMAGCLTLDGTFGNPASRSHAFGWDAEEAVETARQQLADLLHCDPREVVFTSGATESDNLAIKGTLEAQRRRGRHMITSIVEHKAVLDTAKYLEQQGLAEVTWLRPAAQGWITPEQVAEALRDDTVLVSLMHANNEIGVLNDIQAIGSLCREHGVTFHVDAAQSVGKLPLDLSVLPVDLLSLSAHKFYGPKGVGALYVRRDPAVKLAAQIHGGGHERGMRSGTLATHQLVGMGSAAELAGKLLPEEGPRLLDLRTRLWAGLGNLPGVHLNGDASQRLPGNLNVAFEGVDGEALMMALHDIAVSSGSACTSATIEPSYVLRAIGLDDDLAHSAIRFTVGRYTSAADVDHVVARVSEVVTALRGPGAS